MNIVTRIQTALSEEMHAPGAAGGRRAVVTAAAVDRATGLMVTEPRSEEINLDTNRIFKGCRTWQEVKQAYESFWDLDGRSEHVVLVHQVRMI